MALARTVATVVLGCMLASTVGCAPGGASPPGDPPVPVASRETETAHAGAATAGVDSSAESETEISGFRFRVPAGWKRAELTPAQQGFVDARFEFPKHGEDVKLTLSTTGGGVEANIQRWIGQFQMPEGAVPDSEQLDVDGVPVTLVDIRGEFHGMGEAPQSGRRMLGAAYAGEPRDFYIKLTGPEDAVAALEEEFRSFVTSARRVR